MLKLLVNESEDTFPLPEHIKQFYGPFGFPKPPEDRPWITSNFVMGLDGRGSFRELVGRAGGKEVSRSPEDRWLMDFFRAHHDAQIVGGSTLREEPGIDGKGWDYRIEDEELLAYRRDVLKLPKTKVLILTGSGRVDLSFNVFNSDAVDAWIITSKDGAAALASQLTSHRGPAPKVVAIGDSNRIDLVAMAKLLRAEYGVKTLLCEGGPDFYGQLLEARLIDEDFRTLSLQVLGKSTKPEIERPTTYGNASFLPETAPWFKLISFHVALPHHLFLRQRYIGPRTFED